MTKCPRTSGDHAVRPDVLSRLKRPDDGGRSGHAAHPGTPSDQPPFRRVSAHAFLALLIVPAMAVLTLVLFLILHDLDNILLAVSLAEADRTGSILREMSNGTQHARVLVCVLWGMALAFLVLLAVALHHAIIQPLRLASRNLRRIRHNRTLFPDPPVRIRELQEVYDLLPGLSAHLARLTLHSGRLKAEKDWYAALSMVDGLTGINNRRSFDAFMSSEDRRRDALAVLMVDIDLFKRYNDSHGHQAGDKALIAVAASMKQSLLRATDQVFRYGGEEFAALLPNATEKSAMAVATRILLRVRQLNIPHPTSDVAPMITVSIGLALRRQGEDVDDATLVTRADQALYQAKNSGRNRVCVYTPSMSSQPGIAAAPAAPSPVESDTL